MEENKKENIKEDKSVTENNSKKNTKKNKKKLVLADSDELNVRSNIFGKLIYINHKTGDETIWENQGDVQSLTARDLKDMKAKQLIFFKENWISIIGSDSIDEKIYNIADIYEALQVLKYYKNSILPDNIEDVFSWNSQKIKENVKLMPASIKDFIAVRANEKIQDKTLDSISKIKTFEEVLNCELLSPTN